MSEPNNLALRVRISADSGSQPLDGFGGLSLSNGSRELSRKVDAGVPARVALGRPENRGRDAAVHPGNRFGLVK